MDEEEIQEEYTQDQIYLWEQQYLMEEAYRREISLEKPVVIKVIIEQPKTNQNVAANTNHDRTNHPAKRKFHAGQ